MEDSSKSTFNQLLTVFKEIYPAWVGMLQKDPEKKRTTCAGYQKCLEGLTETHLILLMGYLKSNANTAYRRWPPPPLELIQILQLNKKKTNMKTESPSNSPSPITSISDGTSLGHWIGQVFVQKKPIMNAPTEFQPYLVSLHHYRKAPDYSTLAQIHLLYCEMRDHYPKFTSKEFLDRFFSVENRPYLLSRLGLSEINLNRIFNFFYKTRIEEEIYWYLEEKKGDPAGSRP